MSKLIFIDSNIYLRFYDSRNNEFKKLLKSLVAIKDQIFVTSQIVREVERNKLNCFILTFNTFIKNFSFTNISLPDHIDDTNEDLQNWNKELKSLDSKFKGQQEKLFNITHNLMGKINAGNDTVTQALNNLFTRCHLDEEELLMKAKSRKELGNPPGKKEDPIGDELSWEHLLDKIDDVEELWIVSSDGDFSSKFKGVRYLNPYLEEN